MFELTFIMHVFGFDEYENSNAKDTKFFKTSY